MQGEFRGDFTRDTFDPRKNFLRVLMQQGRVQLDADWNEQVAILLHYLQTLAADLIGPYGGPIGKGFQITVDSDEDIQNGAITNFKIGAGHYYVNGILCENNQIQAYDQQKDYPLNRDKKEKLADFPFLVYLDVWERHITYIEDDRIREVALGGPDTATRSKVVCQVRVEQLKERGDNENRITSCDDFDWHELMEKWQFQNRGLLRATARVDKEQTEPCIIQPNARYRGAENQLYRVEIHTVDKAGATFKWSRENGSVAFPLDADSPVVISETTAQVKLQHWWRGDRFSLTVGDWVEIVDDDYVLHQRAEPLWQVEKIEPTDFLVTLRRQKASERAIGVNPQKHPLLRRWDQKTRSGLTLSDYGTVAIAKIESENEDWLLLEDGVQIQFQKPESGKHSYRTGDYWLIPVRTATGNVEWPRLNNEPQAIPPHGIQHHYAPLAVIAGIRYGQAVIADCRHQFYSLAARSSYYTSFAQGIGTNLIWLNAEPS